MGDALVYVRAVHFAATIAFAGVAFFLIFIAEPAFAGPTLARISPVSCGRASRGSPG